MSRLIRSATPSILLIAICVSLFASVVYLWILDATNILPFRKEWISKSIYGAAIASVLGSSVAVYKDFFDDEKYPLQGKWLISIIDRNNKSLSTNELLLGYSKNSKVYYGYSNLVNIPNDSSLISFVEIKSLSAEEPFLIIQLTYQNGKTEAIQKQITISEDQTKILVSADSLNNKAITLLRPNI